MRTTLTLEADAFNAAKAKADYERISLGKAVSELVLQGLRQSKSAPKSSGVFKSDPGLYTSEEVEAALDDE